MNEKQLRALLHGVSRGLKMIIGAIDDYLAATQKRD